MSLAAPELRVESGAPYRFGIAAACFNGPLADGLLARVEARLRQAGVKASNLKVVRVPGSHEVPWAAHALARTGRYDCVIALGVLIAGDTINGVIVANTPAQAKARCVGRINRGAEFAEAALAMAALRRRISK
jgi:6,7-dimethyl-8-ribityllumazine synthase